MNFNPVGNAGGHNACRNREATGYPGGPATRGDRDHQQRLLVFSVPVVGCQPPVGGIWQVRQNALVSRTFSLSAVVYQAYRELASGGGQFFRFFSVGSDLRFRSFRGKSSHPRPGIACFRGCFHQALPVKCGYGLCLVRRTELPDGRSVLPRHPYSNE